MIILLLCEPRSGSTNLSNWFGTHKNFTVLLNPDIEYGNGQKNIWYREGSPKEYKYETEHLLIKEDYFPNKDLYELMNTSDKVVCLYRENESEQIDSWVNAKITNNWDKEWMYRDILQNETDRDFFKELKKQFREKFLSKNYFNISYEELYYNNGLQKVLDYLDIGLKNVNFPYGNKYRVFRDGHNSII